YLDRTVFYRSRDFSPDTFQEAMMAESKPYPEALALVGSLAASGRYLLATLNNESRELNQARIERFELDRYFSVFFSSGFLGVKKPDPAIYRLALQITQRDPGECVFIDDRDLNLECALGEGMHAIHYESPAGLRSTLAELGVRGQE
ncbi:MAG: HAD-IA family hydrolase, partial [Acidimicrobiia bacterium]